MACLNFRQFFWVHGIWLHISQPSVSRGMRITVNAFNYFPRMFYSPLSFGKVIVFLQDPVHTSLISLSSALLQHLELTSIVSHHCIMVFCRHFQWLNCEHIISKKHILFIFVFLALMLPRKCSVSMCIGWVNKWILEPMKDLKVIICCILLI